MSNVLGEMPTFDDIADKDTYKLFKWMVRKKRFTVSDINKKFKSEKDDTYAPMLSVMAIAGYLGIRYSNNNYYSDGELRNISFEQLSKATIVVMQPLARYIEKRESENLHWFLPIILSIISLSVSFLTLVINTLPKTVDVNITSWPTTAETAQPLETTTPQ